MNYNKSLGFLGLGVLLVLVLLSFASAAITFSGVPTLSRSGSSALITITSNSTADETVTFSALSPIPLTKGEITFTPITPSSITVNSYP